MPGRVSGPLPDRSPGLHASVRISADAFSLDPNTGLLRSRRLLRSSEHFNLTLVATDQGRPPLWSTAHLVVTVIDVNDNRPLFVRPANGTIIHISEVPEVSAAPRGEGTDATSQAERVRSTALTGVRGSAR